MAFFAFLDARLRERDEVPVDSLIPQQALTALCDRRWIQLRNKIRAFVDDAVYASDAHADCNCLGIRKRITPHVPPLLYAQPRCFPWDGAATHRTCREPRDEILWGTATT